MCKLSLSIIVELNIFLPCLFDHNKTLCVTQMGNLGTDPERGCRLTCHQGFQFNYSHQSVSYACPHSALPEHFGKAVWKPINAKRFQLLGGAKLWSVFNVFGTSKKKELWCGENTLIGKLEWWYVLTTHHTVPQTSYLLTIVDLKQLFKWFRYFLSRMVGSVLLSASHFINVQFLLSQILTYCNRMDIRRMYRQNKQLLASFNWHITLYQNSTIITCPRGGEWAWCIKCLTIIHRSITING